MRTLWVARKTLLGAGFGISRATTYGNVPEGIAALTARAPDLHDALKRVADSSQQGWVYCGKCGGLYFKSERPTSKCAVNGFFGHQENGSYGYQLIYAWVD
jgi:hypothetical protein